MVIATLAVVIMVGALTSIDATAALSSGRVDGRIERGECRLLGREYVSGRGCSRDHCIRSAHLVRSAAGAELCALSHQGGYAFGAAVEYRRCAALHRRWIDEVNWCASNPDRAVSVIANAPQCTGLATVYVTHTETEGRYDECLKPAVYRRLERLARRNGTTLEQEALLRSRTLCSYRPRHVFTDGRCVPGEGTDTVTGGVLLVGDSIAWRGTDELGSIRPDFTVDGIPSRRLTDLATRLDWFRLDHGDPDGLIVELGTNAARGFGKGDLRAILDSLPSQALVMLVLPYRRNPHAPPAIQPASTRYAEWMRDLSKQRPHTCVADWRSYVTSHPQLLVDGVHPTPPGERVWANWTSRSWRACQDST